MNATRLRSAAGIAVIAIVAVHFALSLERTRAPRGNDFPAYFDAGVHVANDQPARLYDRSFRPDRNKFTNLPIVAFVFVPLSKLGYARAWDLFWWTQVLSYLATGLLLLLVIRRHAPPLDPVQGALVALVLFAFAPVLRRCLVLGQTTPMMVLLLACFVLAVRAGGQRTAGVLLGTICTIKIPPLVLLPLFALRRRLVVAGTAAAVVATAVALSWLVFGGEILGAWVQHVIVANSGSALAVFNNQSLDGAFMRLLTDGSLVDWTPSPRPTAVWAAVLSVLVAIGALLLACGRHLLLPSRPPDDGDPRTGSLELELGVGIALMLLAFPVVWIHYYLFLVVPLALLPSWWRQRGLPHPPWLIAVFVAGVWLAGSGETLSNAFHAAHDADLQVRLRQNGRPLGALLLLGAMCFGVAALQRRALDDRESSA